MTEGVYQEPNSPNPPQLQVYSTVQSSSPPQNAETSVTSLSSSPLVDVKQSYSAHVVTSLADTSGCCQDISLAPSQRAETPRRLVVSTFLTPPAQKRDTSHKMRATSLPLLEQAYRRPPFLHRRSFTPTFVQVFTLSGEDESSDAGPSSRNLPTPTPISAVQIEITEEMDVQNVQVDPITNADELEATQLLQWESLPPSPPRRNLRTRKPAQLAPYTTEMQRYKRRLVRNDWEDAVVIEKEFLRAQREKRREREEEEGTSLVPVSEEVVRPEKRKGSGKGKQRRTSAGEVDATHSRDLTRTVIPLRDRINRDIIMARYGAPPSSSSEAEDYLEQEDRRHNSMPSFSPSQSSSSENTRVGSRKRYRRALRSETESSGSDVQEVIDNRVANNDASDSDGAIIVSDDEEEQGRPRKGTSMGYSADEIRYYKQQLKLLKHTMPMGAAKRHIEDLIAMHREAEEEMRRPRTNSDLEGSMSDSHSPNTLRPGESRKRMAQQRDMTDMRLIDDADEESDDSRIPSPVSSDTETEAEQEYSRLEEEDESGEAWMFSSTRGRRDDIDRMLTSATNPGRARKRAKGTGHSKRQIRLPFARIGEGVQRPAKAAAPARRRHKKQKNRMTTYIRIYSGPSAGPRLLENPPIAKVRNKPKFSLLHDSILFDGISSPSPAGEATETPSPFSSALLTPAKSSPRQAGHNDYNRKANMDGRSPAVHHQTSPLKTISRQNKQLSTPIPQGHKAAVINVDRPSPAQQITPAPLIQKRLETYTHPPIDVTSPHILKQRVQMDIWQDVSDFRLQFGIHPPSLGLSFHVDSFLGKGRLFELIQLAKGSAEIVQPRPISVFGVDLSSTTINSRELQNAFDGARDQLYSFLLNDDLAEGGNTYRISLLELLRYVSLSVTASSEDCLPRKWINELSKQYVEDLIAIIKANKESKGHHHSSLLQSLRWFKVELAWREGLHLASMRKSAEHLEMDITEWQNSFVQACQELMLELLIHGLHHTMHSIKKASQAVNILEDSIDLLASDRDEHALNDQSAQYWIGLLHLLTLEESTELLGPFNSFWYVYEAATKPYQAALSLTKSSLIVAENGWYCLMAINSLGYFTASTGSSTSSSCLKIGHWPLVLQTLSQIRLRADEQVEAAMPKAALQMRDSYIRLLLCRVSQLNIEWGWSYESSEATLGRLFALFDSHKLEDLPTEVSHDFPAFLRLYDESCLMEAIHDDDTAFHIFIKILSRAARDLRASGPGNDTQGERNVARLFSRFSPLRTMTFNREIPPTTLERSALYNHYSIALVYLYLVPTSQHQRLLQIQQYLLFSKADDKSQLVCIRAMMYAITVLQHHSLEIKEAVSWFKGAFKMLMSRLEDLHRIGAAPGHQMKWDRETKTQKTLLIAALRSLQYVIRIETLNKNNAQHDYPSLLLLDSTWTATLLSSQLAQSTKLTVEVFHLIQAFLARRSTAMEVNNKKVNIPNWNTQNDESQDSYADLFEDIDFDDAMLLDAAGYEATESTVQISIKAKQDRIRQLDRDFAHLLHSCISPALFQLQSNLFHPSRQPAFSLNRIAPDQRRRLESGYISFINTAIEETTKTTLAETIIDTWSCCAWIMVEENETRQWSHYFNYGPEDPKRLQSEIAKRDVTMRFLVMISARCLGHKSSSPSGLKMYEANLTEFWSSFMASFTNPNLTSQHLFCNNLRELEWRRDTEQGGLLRQMDWQNNTSWSVDDFEQNRLVLLEVIVNNLNLSWEEPSLAPKSLLFATLSSLMVSMRTYITENEHGQSQEYITFCKAVVQCCRRKLCETIIRGVSAELKKTEAFLETQINQAVTM